MEFFSLLFIGAVSALSFNAYLASDLVNTNAVSVSVFPFLGMTSISSVPFALNVGHILRAREN